MQKLSLGMFVVLTLIVVPLIGMLFPQEVSALPAWGRKYNADCSLCHSPAVPRLNKTGQKFRWSGYRMPDEVGKSQDISKAGNFLSLRARGRAEYKNPEGAMETNRFAWHDTTFFYAGALTKTLSSFTEFEWEDGKVELLSQVRAFFGESSNQFTTIRLGQFHSMQGVGIGGFDRPTGISRPEPLSSRALTSSAIPFRIRENQQGAEVAHVVNNSRFIAQVLNGLAVGGNSGVEGEQDKNKDIMFAYERILDDLASGFTLYGYRGVWNDGTEESDYSFYRYGAVANKIFSSGTEIIGGYFRAEDMVPSAVGTDVQGNSFYVEGQHFLKPLDTTLLARFDWVDPNDSLGGNNRKIETIGVVHTYESHLRLALEGNRSVNDATNKTDYQVVVEAMLNF
ncbi:MAG: hypothetical protein GXO96_06380 [Nitrospirae bacterium]|nr:hypothetical protein [Candidatus Manganitrophaceae bacterium]